jgi:hypothetical protein
VTLPSKYPSSKERERKGWMLDVLIIIGFVGLIYLPIYLLIKGLFSPDASFYVPVATSVVSLILALLVRRAMRYFLDSFRVKDI